METTAQNDGRWGKVADIDFFFFTEEGVKSS